MFLSLKVHRKDLFNPYKILWNLNNTIATKIYVLWVTKTIREDLKKMTVLSAQWLKYSKSLCLYRVTRTHRHPRIHPWPRPIHQPSLRTLPRTASPLSSQLHTLIRIHTPTHIHTRQQHKTTVESRPLSASIRSTCTRPHRAILSKARQTLAAKRSPAQPQ